jgi:Tfp pilus assembly protein PilF
LDPSNIEALELLTTLQEVGNPARALPYRERLVELEPHSESRWSDLITCAIKAGQFDLARERVSQARALFPDSIRLDRIEAQLALQRNDLPTVRKFFQRVMDSREVTDRDRLNWAAVLLSSVEGGDQKKGQTLLEELKSQPAMHNTVLRLQLGAALRLKDEERIKSLTDEIRRNPAINPGDRLLVLNALHLYAKPAFEKELEDFFVLAEQDINAFVQLMGWLNNMHESRRAIEYFKDKKVEDLGAAPRALLWTEALAVVEDWQGLLDFTEKLKWPGYEHQRWAFRTLAIHHLNSGEAARYEQIFWKNALRDASDDPQLLYRLAHWARSFGLEDRAIDALWQITKITGPLQKTALTELYQIYAGNSSSFEMLRVFETAIKLNPQDYVALNNFCLLALLRGVKAAEAHQAADRLRAECPADLRFRSAVAYSLFLRGRVTEANAWLDAHPQPPGEETSADGLYEAIIREANGLKSVALEHLRKVDASRLLPEEKTLYESIKSRVMSS